MLDKRILGILRRDIGAFTSVKIPDVVLERLYEYFNRDINNIENILKSDPDKILNYCYGEMELLASKMYKKYNKKKNLSIFYKIPLKKIVDRILLRNTNRFKKYVPKLSLKKKYYINKTYINQILHRNLEAKYGKWKNKKWKSRRKL